MYDHNGLQLTPMANTMNTYRRTAVNLTERKYAAYAAAYQSKKEFAMATIGLYKDARDAAYVAQEFEKVYDKYKVRQMITDSTFSTIAREFRENIEIPEWKFPAEGLDFDDILGEKYRTNYVNNAREALLERIRIVGAKAPALKQATEMIKKVEEFYRNGMNYRQAAMEVIPQ